MSKTAFRYDRGGTLRPPTTTPQGFLRVDGHAARVGIYEYRRADGSIQRELRSHKEVMHPDSLASYQDASVTLGHPAEEEVTADNVRKHEVGTVSGAARQDGDAVAVSLTVKDAKAIKQIRSGTQELSPGYKIKLDETPGFAPEYATPSNPTGRYDAVQREIRVNHQAVVPRARGGSGMRLRMDDAEIVLPAERNEDTLAAAEHRRLSGSMFRGPDHEGLPLENAAHVRAAMSRFDQEEFKDSAQKRTAYHKILSRIRALGIDDGGFKQKWATRLDSGGRLTTVAVGHQHLVDTCGWDGQQRTGGETSFAMSEGADCAHSHPWTMGLDGTITIGEAAGHMHAVIDAASAPAPTGYLTPTAYSTPKR